MQLSFKEYSQPYPLKRCGIVAALLLYHYRGRLPLRDERLNDVGGNKEYLKMQFLAPQKNSRCNQTIIKVFIYVGINRLFGSISVQCMALKASSPVLVEGFGRFCQGLVDRKCEILRLTCVKTC